MVAKRQSQAVEIRKDDPIYRRRMPCKDCGIDATVYWLREDGWVNLCTDCYKRQFFGGNLPPKINEWTGPTEHGKRMLTKILSDLQRFTKRRPDKSWAQRLLDRVASGERISPIAVEKALEVVSQQASREPGSDDEG